MPRLLHGWRSFPRPCTLATPTTSRHAHPKPFLLLPTSCLQDRVKVASLRHHGALLHQACEAGHGAPNRLCRPGQLRARPKNLCKPPAHRKAQRWHQPRCWTSDTARSPAAGRTAGVPSTRQQQGRCGTSGTTVANRCCCAFGCTAHLHPAWHAFSSPVCTLFCATTLHSCYLARPVVTLAHVLTCMHSTLPACCCHTQLVGRGP